MRLPPVAEVRKAVVAVCVCAAQLVALGVVHGQTLVVVTALLGLFGAGGVYAVRNEPPAPPPPPVAPTTV